MRTILETIAAMSQKLEPGNMGAAIKCLLIELRIPTETKGYRCLEAVIPRYHADPGQSFTKELYPDVGKLRGITGDLVEKQIRTAITSAWLRRDPEVWDQYFPGGRKPTNGEFISRIAEVLDIWMGWKNAF